MATSDSTSDPFDALMQQKLANSQNDSAQPNESDPFDQAMASRSTKSSSAPTDPYEAKIQSHIPEAKQRSKDYGYTSAAVTGAGEMLGVGPAVREAATDIGAAAGYGTGETFGQRREDLKAQYEAQRRVSGEEYPKTQLAADIASQFMIPFVGEVAGPVAAGAEALGAAPTIARIAGMGVEAGALGAGSAAEEKLIGSKPKSEQQDIGTSALIGGGLGVGLGAVGEGLSKVAPEWMKAMVAPKDAALNNLSKALVADEAAGASKIPMADLIKASQEGQPIMGADIGGPSFQRALAKAAKNDPEVMADLVEKMRTRIADAGERFDTFAEKMAGVELNAAKLQDDARQQFETRNQMAWAPIKNPDLGKGTWLPQWNKLLDEPIFNQAIKNADANLSNELGPSFKSAFMNTGETPIAQLKLPNYITSTFNDYGIDTFDDLRKLNNNALKSILKVDPADSTGFAKMAAQKQTNDAVAQVRQTIDNLPPPKTILADKNSMNMQYIDQIRRELDSIQNASFQSGASTQGGVGRRAQSIGKTFMDPIRDKANPYYSRELDHAIKNSQDIFGEKDAFTGGLRLLDKDRNTLAKTNAFNATLGMNVKERELAQQGVLASLLTKTRNGDGSINTKMLEKYFEPSNYTAKAMKNIFGNNGYEKLERFVRTEALFRNSLANVAKSTGRSDPSLYYKLQDLRLVPTFLLSQPLAYAQYAYSIANHIMGARYAKRLADKLASPDIQQFRDAQLMLQQNPRLLSSMAQNMIKLSANAPTAINAIPSALDQYNRPMRSTGGRSGYQDGMAENDEPHPASIIPGFHVVTSQYGQPVFSGRA